MPGFRLNKQDDLASKSIAGPKTLEQPLHIRLAHLFLLLLYLFFSVLYCIVLCCVVYVVCCVLSLKTIEAIFHIKEVKHC